MDLEQIRREYLAGGLRRKNLKSDPFEQFQDWLALALRSNIPDPTAMTLATVDGAGQPSQRIVLLKHSDNKGLVFYTNYESQKGRDIVGNSNVSLHFPWHGIERQVLIKGTAEKVTQAESEQYFATRPRESQIAAWASPQSRELPTRQALLNRYQEKEIEFDDKKVRLPDFWGGYRVVPDYFEFWQGGAHRLHDRFRYTRAGLSWQIVRLAP